MTKKKYRQIVFVVTYAKTKEEIKYLILKRKLHWKGWEFVKGGIDFNENKKETVRREIEEETGKKSLKIRGFKVFGKYDYKKKIPAKKDYIGQAYSLYSSEINYGKIKIDRTEHSTYLWLDFKDAKKRLTFYNQKKCLKIVNDWLEKEHHQGG